MALLVANPSHFHADTTPWVLVTILSSPSPSLRVSISVSRSKYPSLYPILSPSPFVSPSISPRPIPYPYTSAPAAPAGDLPVERQGEQCHGEEGGGGHGGHPQGQAGGEG